MLIRKLKRLLLIALLGVALPVHAQSGPARPEPSDAGQLASLLTKARTCLGTPYRYGGMSRQGFDCSGFVRFVFGSIGVDLDRSSSSQAKQGDRTDLAHIQPGDLLFFNTRGVRKGISHVAIYLGEGQFIHASSWGGPGRRCVKLGELASSYFSDRLVAVRRVLAR